MVINMKVVTSVSKGLCNIAQFIKVSGNLKIFLGSSPTRASIAQYMHCALETIHLESIHSMNCFGTNTMLRQSGCICYLLHENKIKGVVNKKKMLGLPLFQQRW
jgi:hypothetical protein